MIRLVFWILGKNTTDVKYPSHASYKRVYRHQHDLLVLISYLAHSVKVRPASFLHCKVPIFSFSYSVPWKKVIPSNTHSRGKRGVKLYLLENENLLTVYRVLPPGLFASSLPCVYLFNLFPHLF